MITSRRSWRGPNTLGPRDVQVGGDASHGSRRAVSPMGANIIVMVPCFPVMHLQCSLGAPRNAAPMWQRKTKLIKQPENATGAWERSECAERAGCRDHWSGTSRCRFAVNINYANKDLAVGAVAWSIRCNARSVPCNPATPCPIHSDCK